MLLNGIKSLLLFKREVVMVIISVIPTAHLMPYLDWTINFSLMAAKFSSTILYYAGFDVTRQDLIISLPKGEIEVYIGCLGLPAIARTIMGQPKLLILDEPTEGIQPSIILEIETAVRNIVEITGISILLVE